MEGILQEDWTVLDKMVDRNYLPFQSAREHRDRGMMKWLGFFLSEHTSSLADDKNRIDLSTSLTQAEKLTLIGQLYASQLTGEFLVRTGKTKTSYWGQVTELNPAEITIKTNEKYQLLKLKDVLEIRVGRG